MCVSAGRRTVHPRAAHVSLARSRTCGTGHRACACRKQQLVVEGHLLSCATRCKWTAGAQQPAVSPRAVAGGGACYLLAHEVGSTAKLTCVLQAGRSKRRGSHATHILLLLQGTQANTCVLCFSPRIVARAVLLWGRNEFRFWPGPIGSCCLFFSQVSVFFSMQESSFSLFCLTQRRVEPGLNLYERTT